MGAEAADHALRGRRDVGGVPERLAPEDVRQVQLDHRQLGGVQGVEDRDRGVGVGAGVDDDAVRLLARLLDPVDELAFGVGLAEIDRQAQGLARAPRCGGGRRRASRRRRSRARACRAG